MTFCLVSLASIFPWSKETRPFEQGNEALNISFETLNSS